MGGSLGTKSRRNVEKMLFIKLWKIAALAMKESFKRQPKDLARRREKDMGSRVVHRGWLNNRVAEK